ncbi:MAG: CBS domain-containing protein [Blastocatellales bacterium]
MKIQNIMTTNVAACSPDTNLAAVAGQLWENDCGWLPVADGEGKVIGVVTDRDICMAVATKNRPASEIPVHEVMTSAIHACNPNDDVKSAIKTMRGEKVLRLPVVNDEGRLQGVISMNDIMIQTEAGKSGLSCEEVLSARNVISEHRFQRKGAEQQPSQRRARA